MKNKALIFLIMLASICFVFIFELMKSLVSGVAISDYTISFISIGYMVILFGTIMGIIFVKNQLFIRAGVVMFFVVIYFFYRVAIENPFMQQPILKVNVVIMIMLVVLTLLLYSIIKNIITTDNDMIIEGSK